LSQDPYGDKTFLDGYCSTVQGLLDWFEVDLGFTELLVQDAYGDKTFGASGTSGVGRVVPSVSPSLDLIGAKKKALTLYGPVAFLIDAAKLCVCVCACACVCV